MRHSVVADGCKTFFSIEKSFRSSSIAVKQHPNTKLRHIRKHVDVHKLDHDDDDDCLVEGYHFSRRNKEESV
jgi:hypothetical protein